MRKKYEKYKDSGIEWIGKVPEHWEEKRLKYMSTIKSSNVDKKNIEGEKSIRLCNYVDVYYNETINEHIDFMKATASNNEIQNFKLCSDDVLITKDSETWDDIAVPAYVPYNIDDVLCGYHLALIRPITDEALGDYLFRAFMSSGIRDQFIISANGITRYGLSLRAIKDSLFPNPPFHEQATIAIFLNQKTSEIDSLIADKEKLIQRLQEYKQSVITEAVTKGLNPDVKMKDSGIEWIGEVPEHWDISKIKYQANINQKTLTDNTPDEYELKYLDISSVDANGKVLHIEPMLFKNAPSRARRIVSDGDTLVSTVRTYLKAITWFDKADTNLICSTGFAVLTPQKTIESKYLSYLMRSSLYIEEIVSRSVGVSYPAITATEIGRLECLLPPIDEQNKIVNYIDEQVLRVENVAAVIIEQIQKLKEYRQSLIYEAVTGKFDVRDYEVENHELERSDHLA